MKLRSFEELRTEHGLVADGTIARFVISLLAAAAVIGGLILLIPLGA